MIDKWGPLSRQTAQRGGGAQQPSLTVPIAILREEFGDLVRTRFVHDGVGVAKDAPGLAIHVADCLNSVQFERVEKREG